MTDSDYTQNGTLAKRVNNLNYILFANILPEKMHALIVANLKN